MAAFLGSLIFWSWLYMRFFYAYVAVVFYKNQPEWNLLIPASIILTLTAISSLFIRGLYSRHIPRWLVLAITPSIFSFYSMPLLKNIGRQGFSLDLHLLPIIGFMEKAGTHHEYHYVHSAGLSLQAVMETFSLFYLGYQSG